MITPIDLIAGHDYILIADSCEGGDVILKDPGGKVIIDAFPVCDTGYGRELRAQYTATYFIEYDDAEVSAKVVPDCRGDTTTLCHLAVNHTKHARFEWMRDVDTWAVYLNSHYTYTFTADLVGESMDDTKCLMLLDKLGNVMYTSDIATGLVTLSVHPSRTGTYYIRANDGSDESSYDYTLTLRAKR
jgi:hypothetical protein